MAKKNPGPVAVPTKARKADADPKESALSPTRLRASSFINTRVIYCGDNLEQLRSYGTSSGVANIAGMS